MMGHTMVESDLYRAVNLFFTLPPYTEIKALDTITWMRIL